MSPSWRYLLKLALTLLLIAVFFYVVREDVARLPSVLAKPHALTWAGAWVLNVCGTILVPAVVTYCALRVERMSFSFLELVRVNFVVRFYSLVLPRGGAMGLRWHKYRRAGGAGDAFALVIFEKAIQTLVFTAGGLACLTVELQHLGSPGVYMLAASSCVTVAAAFLVALFLWGPPSRGLSTWVRRARRLPAPLHAKLESLWRAVVDFQRLERHLIGYILGWTCLGFAFFVLGSYVIGAGLSLGISLLAFGWIRSFVFVLTMIPVTVAGIGVRELGFVGLFQLYGVPKSDGLGFALSLFALQLSIGLIGGLLEAWEHYGKPIARRRARHE